MSTCGGQNGAGNADSMFCSILMPALFSDIQRSSHAGSTNSAKNTLSRRTTIEGRYGVIRRTFGLPASKGACNIIFDDYIQFITKAACSSWSSICFGRSVGVVLLTVTVKYH